MAKAQILVVEDAKVVSLDIQRRLTGKGYNVCGTADTGEDAVTKAGSLHPDLVLMDICLKGKMDGIQAAEQIRKKYNIPIVYLTANSDDETLQRAVRTEPFGYLLKPFDERDLHTTIEIALYKHQMESNIVSESEQRAALLEVARILAQPWSFEVQKRAERPGAHCPCGPCHAAGRRRRRQSHAPGILVGQRPVAAARKHPHAEELVRQGIPVQGSRRG